MVTVCGFISVSWAGMAREVRLAASRTNRDKEIAVGRVSHSKRVLVAREEYKNPFRYCKLLSEDLVVSRVEFCPLVNNFVVVLH